MTVERHYDEDALVTMLDAGVMDSDPHLAACGECAERLEDFRMVTAALRDAATWDQREVTTAPNANTIATLRAFADTMAAEDAAAQGYLAELLAGPRETWMANLAAHPEWRTAGMVRGLIAATDRALDTMPAEAVEITALATNIAEALDPSSYCPDTVARLRGAAWRERAYALFYTGQYLEAEKGLALADHHFALCAVAEYDVSRLGIVHAVVERELEHYASALTHARGSATAFERFGDVSRQISARLAEVNLQFSRGEFMSAHAVLTSLETVVRSTGNTRVHAMILGNLGYCSFRLGRTTAAMQYQQAAADLFELIGDQPAATRARWNIASMLGSEGQADESIRRLESIGAEFMSFGMTGSATEAALERAELLLAHKGDFESVESICRTAIQTLEAEGLAYTAHALTALALMREAAHNRSATPKLVRQVREYLTRLPEQPNLIFAPPPPA